MEGGARRIVPTHIGSGPKSCPRLSETLAPPARFELALPPPEGGALSPELRGHVFRRAAACLWAERQCTSAAANRHSSCEPVPVPAYVGIDRVRALQAPVRTYDGSGQIWLEGRETDDITLAQFFAVWGVRFGDHCLGSRVWSPGRHGRWRFHRCASGLSGTVS